MLLTIMLFGCGKAPDQVIKPLHEELIAGDYTWRDLWDAVPGITQEQWDDFYYTLNRVYAGMAVGYVILIYPYLYDIEKEIIHFLVSSYIIYRHFTDEKHEL